LRSRAAISSDPIIYPFNLLIKIEFLSPDSNFNKINENAVLNFKNKNMIEKEAPGRFEALLVEVAAEAVVSDSGGGKERELRWGEVRNVGLE